MDIDQVIGPITRQDGYAEGPLRIGRQNELITSNSHGRYYEATVRGQLFSLAHQATSGTIAAGNIVGAAAAASTQFGLINPLGSGKYLVLAKFGMGVISGTPPGGPLFHGYIPGIASLTAPSPGGTVRSNILSLLGSVAVAWVSAAGAALTGSTQLPTIQRVADFSATATAQAIANGHIRAIEMMEGGLIIPPGVMWLPLWSGAGTTLLNAYSITWEETPYP